MITSMKAQFWKEGYHSHWVINTVLGVSCHSTDIVLLFIPTIKSSYSCYHSLYRIGTNFHQFRHLLSLAKFLSVMPCVNDYTEDMATFAILKIYSTQYFCKLNAKVAGLGEIFAQWKFSAVSANHFLEECLKVCTLVFKYMYTFHTEGKGWGLAGI